jgi:hypothetical protein
VGIPQLFKGIPRAIPDTPGRITQAKTYLTELGN